MIVFYYAVSCSLVENDRRFIDAYCLHHKGDDKGSKHLRNVRRFLTSHIITRRGKNLKSHYVPINLSKWTIIIKEQHEFVAVTQTQIKSSKPAWGIDLRSVV
jgi:hypothetical protein